MLSFLLITFILLAHLHALARLRLVLALFSWVALVVALDASYIISAPVIGGLAVWLGLPVFSLFVWEHSVAGWQ